MPPEKRRWAGTRPVAPRGSGSIGVHANRGGVEAALFSAHADAVDLCLFEEGGRETDRLPLARGIDAIWRAQLGGIGPGQLYGFRVHGPWAPEAGHRFNPAKLLLDPYARAITGRLRYDDAIWGHVRGAAGAGLRPDRRDSAPYMPRCVVPEPNSPARHTRPRRPWTETVLYEAHPKGLTQLHPEIPPDLRGTYAALGHPAIIAHLQRLGATALELLPVHHIADEPALIGRGLTNYWGYSTLGFFAAEPRYGQAAGLKSAVRALHEAGIEVILDVVYNHTAEGDDDGPTLSFRGIDGASYYKRQPGDPGRFLNVTGCGNTLDASHPQVVRLIVDSLRFWADEYGVDGFRFDLAPALAREPFAFDRHAAVLAAIGQDPLLSGLKLIAEPWDVGEGGYRLGQFPDGWGEWNDRHRDAVRAFWRGDPDTLPRLTQGLTGSKEVFAQRGRTPQASINYAVSHDGFTLRDLVSYEQKHNEANGEGNLDGHGHNLSANHGHEGKTGDPAIRTARRRSMRNLLASVFLSQGVPMLLAGDELGRTQRGNNNAYCQDNDLTWVDWSEAGRFDPDLATFVASLTALRHDHAALRRTTFLTGERDPATGLKDVYWLHPSGRERIDADWADPSAKVLGMQFGNDASDGRRLLLLLNGAGEDVSFRLAPDLPGRLWRPIFASDRPIGSVSDVDLGLLPAAGTFDLPSRSLVLFRHES